MRDKGSISSNVLWKFSERITAQAVSFVVSLVLARLLLPEEYGTVALVLVFIELANAFVSFGLGNSLIQKKDADDCDFSSVLYFNVCLSLVLYVVLFFFAPLIASYYENDLLVPVVRVFSLRLILAAINSVQNALIAKRMQFRKFFWATLSGTIISGGVGIFLAYKGFGVWALVAQYLTNTSIDTIVLCFSIKWKPRIVYSWERIGQLFRYGWKILFEGLSNSIAGQVRNLLIGKVYTASDLGFYSRGGQFPSIIMNNINSSISAVLFPAMSKEQDDEAAMLLLMRKAIRISSYILFPMLWGLAAVANNLVSLLLTEKWLPCVPYIYITCASSFISIGMYARHEALKAKGRSDVFLLEHFFARVINLTILFLVYKISVLAVALSGLVGTLILAGIIVFTSRKYTGYHCNDQIKDVLGLVMMSVAMFIPTFILGTVVDWSPLVELIIQVFMGIGIYLVLSIAFKPEGYRYCLNYVKGIIGRIKGVH